MKSIFKSKTFWFGVLQIVFGGIGLYTGWIDQQLAWGLVTTGCASIGLRFKTNTPVSITGNQPRGESLNNEKVIYTNSNNCNVAYTTPKFGESSN